MGKSIRNLSTVTRVGLDLAKRVFQVHTVDAKGEIVVARKLTRSQLIPFFAVLPPCVVAMEACASAHHWGRALIELGHEVRLLPPAHVKPYVRRNKSDAVDAAADLRGDELSWPAVRAGAFDRQPGRADASSGARVARGQRTAALNALRGHLAEIGVVGPQGVQHAYDLKRLACDGFDENGEVIVPEVADLLLKFVQAFGVQTTHTAICNAQSRLDVRLARWLLMAHDRIGDDLLPLTHEFLLLELGVRRPGAHGNSACPPGPRIDCVWAWANRREGPQGNGTHGDAYGTPEAEYRRLIG